MSSYMSKAKHPKTGEVESVIMHDDYFGKRAYGVEFEGGEVYPLNKIDDADKGIENNHWAPDYVSKNGEITSQSIITALLLSAFKIKCGC